MENIYQKYRQLFYLQKYFDLQDLIKFQSYEANDIMTYYKKTHKLFYKTFASKDGFMHVGLSENGYYKKDCGYELYQLNIIKETIQQIAASYVTEIGCGQCTNLKYLSTFYPNVNFFGIDLIPTLKNIRKNKNVKVYSDDYHRMDTIKDSTQSLIYAIETVCYSSQKSNLLKTIHQKLDADGMFLMFDIFLGKPRESLLEIDQIYLNILENAYCLNPLQLFCDFETMIINSGFKIYESQDLSTLAMPYLSEIEARMSKYLNIGGSLLKILLSLYPKAVTQSMPPGVLMKQMVEEKYLQYRYILLKKQGVVK